MDKITLKVKGVKNSLQNVQNMLKPLQVSSEKFINNLTPLTNLINNINEAIRNIYGKYNTLPYIVPQSTLDAVSAYEKQTAVLFNKTAKYQWFYDRKMLLRNGINIEKQIINSSSKKEIDKLFIKSYNKVLPQIFRHLKNISKDKKLYNCMKEVKWSYDNRKYYLCIASCQPIIENALQRLNCDDKITRADAIRNLISNKFENDTQMIYMINNSVCELFCKYYYCDDKFYPTNSQIPNRHNLAHGFSFSNMNQKSALNMIILLDILYSYIEYLKL